MIEMPLRPITQAVLDDLSMLRERQRLLPVLAHVERYDMIKDEALLEELIGRGLVLQISAAAMKGFFSRRRMLRLLGSEMVSLVGSDCHNVSKRPPNMPVATAPIEACLPADLLERRRAQEQRLLRGALPLKQACVAENG